MRQILRKLVRASLPVIAIGLLQSVGQADTIDGWSMLMQSQYGPYLYDAGFVGTYIDVADSGSGGSNVDFTVNAGRYDYDTVVTPPHMNLVVADTKIGFNLDTADLTDYSTSVWLPAGKYVVRAERDYSNNYTGSYAYVNSLTVQGATIDNYYNDQSALDAADTYIANFRKGPASVALPGVAPGTQVHAELARHAFNFGTAVPGTQPILVDRYFGTAGTPQQTNYQAHLNQNFNAIVPENAGKWESNLVGLSGIQMSNVDQILNYAQSHGMRVRMHNLIWGNQQPSVVNSLLDAAVDDPGPEDDTEAASTKALLRTWISNRIDYYVGTGTASDRANRYVEIDVYNESAHTGAWGPLNSYWNIYGEEGIAGIYHEVAQTVAASGASAKLFVNEYNVLPGFDYANWYSQHISGLRNAGAAAGYGDVVGGIGIQYYPYDSYNYSSEMQNALQNLSTQGLPMALTEFGAQEGIDAASAAQILDEALRLMFGTANATGFFMWGFQTEDGGSNLFAPASALFQVNTTNWNVWTITEAGKRWQDLLGIQDWDGDPANGWDTSLFATVNVDGTIDFDGFYGDYLLTINGQQYPLSLLKGQSQYTVTVPEPSSLQLIAAALVGVIMLGRRARQVQSAAEEKGRRPDC